MCLLLTVDHLLGADSLLGLDLERKGALPSTCCTTSLALESSLILLLPLFLGCIRSEISGDTKQTVCLCFVVNPSVSVHTGWLCALEIKSYLYLCAGTWDRFFLNQLF